MEHVDRVPLRMFDRPSAFFKFFNKRYQDIQLVVIVAAIWSVPKQFNFFQGCPMIGVGADWTDIHGHLLKLRHSQSINCVILCVRSDKLDERYFAFAKLECDDEPILPPAISNLARSPFNIVAFEKAAFTSPIEFQWAAFTIVYQWAIAAVASGCIPANADNVFQAISLMTKHSTFPTWEQA